MSSSYEFTKEECVSSGLLGQNLDYQIPIAVEFASVVGIVSTQSL